MFLGIDFNKFLSLDFWFETRPGELSSQFETIFLVIVIACYVLYGVSILLVRGKTKRKNFVKAKFWQKVRSFWITLAITISFIFFFRYEAIPVLGGRFWSLFWALGAIVWAGYLLNNYFRVVPKQIQDVEQTKVFMKYLPKRKKK